MKSGQEEPFIIQNYPLIVHLDDILSFPPDMMQRLMGEIESTDLCDETRACAQLVLDSEGAFTWHLHEAYRHSLISALLEKLAYVLYCYLYKGSLDLSALSLEIDETPESLLNIGLFCSDPPYVLFTDILKALDHLPSLKFHLNVHFNAKRVVSFTDACVVEPDFSLSYEFIYSEPLRSDEHGHEVFIQRYIDVMTEHLRVLACPLLQTLQWIAAAQCYIKHLHTMQYTPCLNTQLSSTHPIKPSTLIKNRLETDNVTEIHLSIKDVLTSLKETDYLSFSTVFQGTLEYPESYHKSVKGAISRLLTNKTKEQFTFEVSSNEYHRAACRLQELMQSVGTFCRESLNAFVTELNSFKPGAPIVLAPIKRNDRLLFEQQINVIRHAMSTLDTPEAWENRFSELLTQFDEKEKEIRQHEHALISVPIKRGKPQQLEAMIQCHMKSPSVTIKNEPCTLIIPQEQGRSFRCGGEIYLNTHYVVKNQSMLFQTYCRLSKKSSDLTLERALFAYLKASHPF